MDKNKRWCIVFFCLVIFMLGGLASVTVIIDPFFHYHKPLEQLEYPMKTDYQLYINNGVLRNFDYDALIIGSSMTENFKTSQLDELFGVHSVKTGFAGNSLYVFSTNIQTAIDEQEDLSMVLTCLDVTRLRDHKDFMEYDMSKYPTYLYDDNIFNDVQYVLNKDILLEETYDVIKYTQDGNQSTTFDEYCNWMDESEFGAENVLARYQRIDKKEATKEAQEAQSVHLQSNVMQNVVDLAKANPQVEFYVFFPPYSICWWDYMDRFGAVEWQIDVIEYTTELVLECENVHLYAFYEEYDIICDLENYRDITHYSESINEQILIWMANGEHELTKENYEQYFEDMKTFYMQHDYDAYFNL